MSESTRRGFLAMAGAGAAAVGVAALAPAAGAATVSSKPITTSGPVVAYIHDVAKGELSVMVGEREVIVQDRDLVNRLARAAS